MDFEVYCDENHPELFTSKQPKAEYLMIGSLWLPSEIRQELKSAVWKLRNEYDIWGEIKWRKVSHSSLEFYKAIVDLFASYGEQLRFRCIAISQKQFDKSWCDSDSELGFYKFYYQLLHHWISDFNNYKIFCDAKTNRDPSRLNVLKQCLDNANITSGIYTVQSLPSREVVLIQISDLLLGIASSRINQTLNEGSAKKLLTEHLEKKLGRQLQPTFRTEKKFNIFQINLNGGW